MWEDMAKLLMESSVFIVETLSCQRQTFLPDYTNKGFLQEVKTQIVDMALNGSGIRDTARVLNVSPTTVMNTLKKKNPELHYVNEAILGTLAPQDVNVVIQQVNEAELDEDVECRW